MTVAGSIMDLKRRRGGGKLDVGRKRTQTQVSGQDKGGCTANGPVLQPLNWVTSLSPLVSCCLISSVACEGGE